MTTLPTVVPTKRLVRTVNRAMSEIVTYGAPLSH